MATTLMRIVVEVPGRAPVECLDRFDETFTEAGRQMATLYIEWPNRGNSSLPAPMSYERAAQVVAKRTDLYLDPKHDHIHIDPIG